MLCEAGIFYRRIIGCGPVATVLGYVGPELSEGIDKLHFPNQSCLAGG